VGRQHPIAVTVLVVADLLRTDEHLGVVVVAVVAGDETIAVAIQLELPQLTVAVVVEEIAGLRGTWVADRVEVVTVGTHRGPVEVIIGEFVFGLFTVAVAVEAITDFLCTGIDTRVGVVAVHVRAVPVAIGIRPLPAGFLIAAGQQGRQQDPGE